MREGGAISGFGGGFGAPEAAQNEPESTGTRSSDWGERPYWRISWNDTLFSTEMAGTESDIEPRAKSTRPVGRSIGEARIAVPMRRGCTDYWLPVPVPVPEPEPAPESAGGVAPLEAGCEVLSAGAVDSSMGPAAGVLSSEG